MRFFYCLCFFFFLIIFNTQAKSSYLFVYDLKCEYLVNPVGIDQTEPRFFWKIKSNLHSTSQVKYEILVAKDSLFRQKVWDSKMIASEQSQHILYKGDKLLSGQRYYWKVRIWDNHGHNSSWSKANYFEMGLLNPTDWKAKWIQSKLNTGNKVAPVVYFRKDFNLSKHISKARIYITSHGIYRASINGKDITNDLYGPGWTSYSKQLQYQVYDITDKLRRGENAIGVMVADGWYKGNLASKRAVFGDEEALLVQLEVTYADGSSDIIITDDSWKASNKGPIRLADFYNGEIYDASMEFSKWDKPNFEDNDWARVFIQRSPNTGKLIGMKSTPVRVMQTIKPISLHTNKRGEKILDFGQNMVGYVKFKIPNNKSRDTIELLHAEVLDRDGNFYTQNLRAAKQSILYLGNEASKEKSNYYSPTFSFQGFRYVKVNANYEVSKDDFEAHVVYTDLDSTGGFETSNLLINKLQQNIVWSQRGNFLEVPTDCPQRDERLGWTADAQVFFNTASFNMDIASFFDKYLTDFRADQFEDGSLPRIVPYIHKAKHRSASAGWADAIYTIPWNYYTVYGDKKVLVDNYDAIKRWLKFVETECVDNLWIKGNHYGDWLFYAPQDDLEGKSAVTDKHLIAQTFYVHGLNTAVKIAKLINNEADITYFLNKLELAKKAFQEEYVSANGRLLSDTQTAYVLALQFDVLNTKQRSLAVQRLVENIKRYKTQLTTGFLGTSYLCHVLSENGYEDLAYELLLQDKYPSWLYPVKMGATTIWERWDGIKPNGTFQNASMNSFNHYAYGAIGDWMYKNLGGIKPIESIPGYKQFQLAPRLNKSFTYVNSNYESMYGLIESNWIVNTAEFIWTITIPPNTSAQLLFPIQSDYLEENGKVIPYTKKMLKRSGTYVYKLKM